MSRATNTLKKYQFIIKHVSVTKHVIEAENVVSAVEQFDEKYRSGDLNYDDPKFEKTENEWGPKPVCENCGEVPSTVFRIACCRKPTYPHSAEDIEHMEDMTDECGDWR